jgi:hypothetical protein
MNKEYLEVGNSVYGRIFPCWSENGTTFFFILQEQAAKEAFAAELAATGIDPEAGKKVRNNLGRPNFLFNFGNWIGS